jgi:hypothetical protein
MTRAEGRKDKATVSRATKSKTRRKTIARKDIKRPGDTGETLEDIEKRVGKLATTEALVEGTTGATVNLERKSIHVAAKVFQWRVPKHNMLPSDDHIFRMARAIQQQRLPLTPIIVFPVEDVFYVMDGHHRLAAYDTAGWKKVIPARVYQGSLEAAWLSALGYNSRDKLPMDQLDKTFAAWRIVKKNDPRYSKSTIMKLTAVAKGTVDNMRAVWKKINDGKHGTTEELQELTWSRARSLAEGRKENAELEDWREAEANKLVEELHRAKLIGRLTKHPDVTALALAQLADGLPAALMAEWTEETERIFDPHEEADDDEF